MNSITLIYFSPTGTTKKITQQIAKGLNLPIVQTIDLTSPAKRNQEQIDCQGDIVIIGLPVYEEHIPVIVRNALTKIKANGQPAVLTAVYGNIGAGIVLNELESISNSVNLIPVAGANFIAEHSFTCDTFQIAENRPDSKDLAIAFSFGERIAKKMQSDFKKIQPMPKGKLPLMARILPEGSAKLFVRAPKVNANLCNHCNLCVESCPSGAIDKDTLLIDKRKCIRCFACVRCCKKGARNIVFVSKPIITSFLKIQGSKRKEPEMYI